MVEGTKPIDYYTDDKGIVHPIFDAGVIAGLTVGSVLFAGAGGIISQDNSNLFWDDTNKRLGIGTASPDDKLHIVDTRTANESAALFIQHTGSTPAGASYGIVVEKTGATSRTNVGASFSAAGADNNYGLLVPDGKVGIGTTSPSEKLEVNGNIISSNLTTGSVLFAGANGLISQNNADFFWHTANKRLGIGTTNPYSKFHVKGTSHEYLYLEVPSGYVAGWIFKEAAANKFQIRYYAGVFRIYDYGAATDVFNIKAGKVGIGTTSPATSALLDLTSATGALLVSRMTTVQRDALTAINGMIIYNSTTNAFNFYEAGAWVTGSGLA